jgi:hypothetical protein
MNTRVSTRLLSPRLLFVVLTALAAAATAQATQVALIGDASVSTARPTTNFGSLSNHGVITVNAGDVIGLINPTTAPTALTLYTTATSGAQNVAVFSLVAMSAGTPGVTGAAGLNGLTGAQGATGATGTLSAVTNWNSSVTYQIGQVVYCAACSTNGSRYIALAPNINVDPPSNLNTIWQLITKVGANGVNGDTGATGATGSTSATGPFERW